MSSGSQFPPRLIVPTVTVGWLDHALKQVPPDVLNDNSRWSAILPGLIFGRLLGKDWVERHVLAHLINAESQKAYGHIEADFSSDVARETKSMRLFDFAEMLLNLQMVEGFHERIEKLRTAGPDEVESSYAELQVAKLLYLNEAQFRFVIPRGKIGDDYDYEIVFSGGVEACADSKCKLESTDVNPRSVRKSLDQARAQLPPDKPGIIFIKVPQHWWSSDMEMTLALRDEAAKFLRGTGRIAAVKFYVSHLTIDKVLQTNLYRHAVDEVNNPNCRFVRKNWDMFKADMLPRAMPAKWIDLLKFGEEACQRLNQ